MPRAGSCQPCDRLVKAAACSTGCQRQREATPLLGSGSERVDSALLQFSPTAAICTDCASQRRAVYCHCAGARASTVAEVPAGSITRPHSAVPLRYGSHDALMCIRALLLLALAAGRVAGAPLLPSFTYPLSEAAETLIVARSVWLGGLSVRNATATAPTAVACIKACRLDGACEWVNWCPLQARRQLAIKYNAARRQPRHRCCAPRAKSHARSNARLSWAQAGCNDGISPLAYQGCRMLSGKPANGSSCTLSPPVVGRLVGEQQDTAGEPGSRVWMQQKARRLLQAPFSDTTSQPSPALLDPPRPAGFAVAVPPIRPPGYIARPGQEIVGFDFTCPGSVVEGMCALPSGLGGVLVCSRLPECQAVAVYPQGKQY